MEHSDNQGPVIRRYLSAALLVLILSVAAILRLDGLDWDEGTHLHPDERFLTTVESAIEPTFSVVEYFSTATSPLSPYNRGYGFFVYGTLPIFLVRYVAEGLQVACSSSAGCTFPYTGYDGVHLVGRALSAVADLATVLVVYFIGRRLYDRRVGLLAAALGALTVLPIQQAHFFTVDTFLTLFVALAFLFAVRVALGDDRRNWAFSGLGLGMALACKISVWPLGLVLVGAGLIRLIRSGETDYSGPTLGLAVAAGLAFLTFRVLQPYSFVGPGFTREVLGDERFASALAEAPNWWSTAYDLMPEPVRAVVLPAPEWLGNMRTIQDQMGGNVDFPPNHQWTDRTPIVFPWKNMVLYGMGLPLGLAVWAGWAAAIVGSIRRRSRTNWQKHLLPVVWVTVFFLYQGTQWVKSMRYLLPIYPILTLLGAWFLISLWDSSASSQRRRRAAVGSGAAEEPGSSDRRQHGSKWRWAAGVLLALVIIGTAAWAWGFTGIYRRPFTRVAASRWIYENVPTGATLLYESTEGDTELNLHIPIVEYSVDGMSHVTRFEMPVDGVVTGVRMNYLSDPMLDPGEEVLRVALSDRLGSGAEIAADVQALNLEESANSRGDGYRFRFAPTPLQAGETYSLITEIVSGAPARSTGAYLVNESSWDDGLPWRVDGLDGFSMYEGQPLELYWEDDADKRERMIEILNRGEYLFISSTRQLGSITRLPPRYPLTIAYYQALFQGRLGYELIETFTGDIQIGPLVVDDVFGEVGWGEAPTTGWPPPGDWAAEEAFSVYDHPPVWIFRKQSDYSPATVRAELDAVNIERRRFVIPLDYTNELEATRRPWLVRWLSPDSTRAESPAPQEMRSMWLSSEAWADQQAGGTWSAMFDPEGLLNQHPWLGAAVWWSAALVLGWLAFPLANVALGGLPSKGYVVSKALALLVLSWFTWIGVSVGKLPYTSGTIWLAVLCLALVGLGLAWWRRRQLAEYLRRHWRLLLLVEGVALSLFIISLLIRSGNPDLWHPTFGGEKPMNLAMLNAVLKSTSFPPYDAWLAGAYVNYYYYGYVLIGNLIKLLGIVPTVAYNLALPMLFSLAGIGAFSISFDLVEGLRRRDAGPKQPLVPFPKRAVAAGLAAAVVMVLLGNLGQVWTVVHGWNMLGGDEGGWLIETGRGLLANLSGERIPIYTGSWYWDATRIIPPGEGEAGPITEFPFFTFLYADLHAHMIDMPLVLLAMAWSLGLAQWASQRPPAGSGGTWARKVGRIVLVWLVGALAIGALRATNTWDWPTFLGVGAVAVTYASWRTIGRRWWWPAGAALGVGALAGLGALLFRPQIENFVPAYAQVSRWRGGITPLWAYMAVQGLFLFVLLTFLGREYADWTRRLTDRYLEALEPWGVAIGVGVLLVLVVMVAMLVLGVPIGPLVILIMVPAGLLALQSSLAVERRAVLTLLTLGLALTLAVELVVFAGDISRMNTVFKFYVQVWLIFSAIGGAALIWSLDSVRRWRPALSHAWLVVLGCLVMAAALYPPTATAAKLNDRFDGDQAPAGLDGMAYMLTATHYDRDQAIELKYDHGVIRWLQDNVTGSPVIMEANTYPKIYGWGSRISIYTGLPSVVGWEWHTRQHRAAFPDAEEVVRSRAADVILFYNTLDTEQALEILERYGVAYVIVGPLERAYTSPEGIAKFGVMAAQGMLTEVFRNDGAVIYEVE